MLHIRFTNSFENLVNYDKSKTSAMISLNISKFENLVNYDKSKTNIFKRPS
mgnify:CR=1 FL=1